MTQQVQDSLTFRGRRLGMFAPPPWQYTVGGEPFDLQNSTACWRRYIAHYKVERGKCATLVRVDGGVVESPVDATWLTGPYIAVSGSDSFELNFRNGILTAYRKADTRWERAASNLLGSPKCLEEHETWRIRMVREYLTAQGVTTPEALLDLLELGRNRRMDCWDLLKQPGSKAAKRLSKLVASTLSIDVSQETFMASQLQLLKDGDVRMGMIVRTPQLKYAHLSHSIRVKVASMMWWTPMPLWEGGKFTTWYMGEILDNQANIRDIEISAQGVDSFGAMMIGLVGRRSPY